MTKIAIIGSGILAKEIAERAKELKIESHCFSFDENDIACKFVNHFHKVDIFNTEVIVNICRIERISGVIPTTELTIFPASKIATELGTPTNSVLISEKITDKYWVRTQADSVLDLQQPDYSLYIDGVFPHIDKYPVVVKPVAAGGKRGVTVVFSDEELQKAIDEAKIYSRIDGVLIEEYLNGGSEYSVETLSYHGKHYITQITKKITSGPPHCNELGHQQPAIISNQMRDKVKDTISRLHDAVGFLEGPSHTEIKIIDNEVYLIELNGRPGGDHITYPLTELSTGYPYLNGIIYAALGKLEGMEPIELKHNYAGIFFVTDKTLPVLPLFDECEKYDWLYQKHKVSSGASRIQFNDEEGLNYFIYYDKERIPEEIVKINEKL